MKKPLTTFVRFLGSFHLAVIVILLMLLLTFLGTWEQRVMSLYDVQEKYFASYFTTYEIGGVVPVPLPGAYLLLPLLFVNLVVGGIWRMRKRGSTAGILVIHIGILFLLLAGFVEDRWSTKGHMTLHEGERSDEYQAYFQWEIAIASRKPDGTVREHIVPHDAFADLGAGDRLTVTHPDLPFDLEVTSFLRNAEPVQSVTRSAGEGAEGWVLRELEPEMKAEANTAACYVKAVTKVGRQESRAILWALQRLPYVLDVAGEHYEIHLRRRRWDVPFTIELDRFVHEMHPGTSMARRFSSYVTQIDDGVAKEVHITMNEPLRHEGFTFYQSGWGPQNAPPGTPLFSTFAVVENPSDQWPLYACIVIAIGLLIHWIRKLALYLKAEARRRAAAEGAS